MAPEVSSPAALRLPGLGYRSLREAPVGRISVAPSGTKAGMAPVVSSPAALRLPGREWDSAVVSDKKPPPPTTPTAVSHRYPPFFIRFCTARQSWRGYSGVLIQAWSSSQVNSHFRSGPAITFR